MFSKRWLFLLTILLSVLVALPTNAVFAQGGDDDAEDEDFPIEIEITGEVEFVDEDIVVEGFVIAPAGAFRPSSLNEGDVVTINGTLLDDDTIKADDLEIVSRAEDEDSDDAEDEDDGNGNGNGRGNGRGNDDDEDEDDGNGRGNNGNGNGNGRGNDDDDDDDEDGNGNGNGRGNGRGEGDDEDGEGEGCERDDHPVLETFVDEFDVDYETLMEWRCDGNGLGEIARALLIEQETGVSAQSLLERRDDGEGWGEIMKDLDLNPSDFAPGKHKIKHGHGRENAPGQQDRDDRPGNGNSKDKDKDSDEDDED